MSKEKSNFNQALWLSISYACNMLVAILSSAILSRYFDKVEYGTYKQIIFVYQVMLTIFQAGLPSVFTYFLPRYKMEEAKYIVNKVNMLLLLLGAFFSITLFVSSSLIADLLNNPELSFGLKIFSIFPLFTLPTMGVEGICTVNRNTGFYAKYQVFTRLLMLIFIVCPVIFIKNDYKTAVIGWGVASFITFILAIYAKKYAYKGYKTIKIKGISSQIFKYSLPIMASSIIGLLFNSSNQFFISRYYGTEAFADYSNGYLTLPFVAIFISPVRALLVPIFSKANKEGDYTQAMETMFSSMRQIAILMIPLVAFSFIYASDIITFIYGSAYFKSHYYFQMFLIFNFVEIFVFPGILYSIGRTDLSFKFTTACTVFLLISCYLCVKSEFGNPYIIVLLFLISNITAQYVLPGLFLIKKIHLAVLNTKIIIFVLKILLHTFLVAMLTSFVMTNILHQFSELIRILISLPIFYILLQLSARLIHVNYFEAVTKYLIKR